MKVTGEKREIDRERGWRRMGKRNGHGQKSRKWKKVGLKERRDEEWAKGKGRRRTRRGQAGYEARKSNCGNQGK